MKKLIAVAAAVTALFTLAPMEAEAGHRSKVIGYCNHCNSNVYSYYRPVRYSDGCVRYAWVPAYHSNCQSRGHSRSYGSSHYRSYGHSHYRSYGSPHYRSTPRYYGNSRSCSSSGITLHFGRSSISFR